MASESTGRQAFRGAGVSRAILQSVESRKIAGETPALRRATSAGFFASDSRSTTPARKSLAAIFGKDRAAGEQAAKSEQQKARLAQGNVPEDAGGLVARVLAERAARRVV